VAPVPEQEKANGGGRVNGRSIAAAIEKVLGARLGGGRHIAQILGTDIYFQSGVMQKIETDPALWRELRTAVLSEPGIQDVFETENLKQKPAAGGLERAEALADFRGRSGDATIALKPYWILSSGGTTHGTANEYDQRVPILLYGAGIKPGEYGTASSPADIAPTLAALAGVPLPRVDGHALIAALSASSARKR
jgi:hypothetical protein